MLPDESTRKAISTVDLQSLSSATALDGIVVGFVGSVVFKGAFVVLGTSERKKKILEIFNLYRPYQTMI